MEQKTFSMEQKMFVNKNHNCLMSFLVVFHVHVWPFCDLGWSYKAFCGLVWPFMAVVRFFLLPFMAKYRFCIVFSRCHLVLFVNFLCKD